ncbi:MAG: hypothetical protein ACJA0Q_002004 [Saprospiraceae bacterium]|jgi:hypothetical protein
MKNLIPIVFSLFLFNSCNQSDKGFGFDEQSPSASESAGYESNKVASSDQDVTSTWTSGNLQGTVNFTEVTTTGGSAQNKKKKTTQKIIYTADMRFQVKNVDESTKAIKTICEKYGAHVSKMNLNSETYRVTNTIQIRVSEDSFNKMIEDFKKSSVHMDELNIKSDDVTAEFIDIKSRLKTKKASRDRYIAVLQTKAGTVEEIINAEEAIRRITEEIEAKQGRLRYLQDKVKFSTITLNIYQVIERPETTKYITPYLDKAKDGFGNGWSFIVKFTLVIINLWPLVILISLLVWKRKWLNRKLSGK